MLRALSLCLVAAVLSPSLCIQVPFDSGRQVPLGEEDVTNLWSLHKLPNPNTTDHLVFETVHSLLQRWPNTRMRNGHNIVPGIIPEGTLLYHGRPDKEIPTVPEWTAMDPEHSYLFCRDIFNSTQEGGWKLTLMTTRPLKIVHFDGSSAVKIPFGPMDTQDLITSGKPSPCMDLFAEEYKRVDDLCEWGKKFGIDGFVRMQMDFEFVLCDFTSGVSVVSFENLASRWDPPSPFSSYEFFEVIHSGSWHNSFPGETRIQLDLAGLVSFYDTKLAPSLVPIRAGQDRWDHRAINISSQELSAVKSRLEANLMRSGGSSSGIDWKTLLHVIVDRYAERLELVHHLLKSPATVPEDTLDVVKKAQTQLRIMLTPYILFSAAPTNPSSSEVELDWTIPIYKLCSTTHTHSMESKLDLMTDSEKLILQAIRGTSREICRVTTKMWAAGVHAGIDPLLNTKEALDIEEVAELQYTWAEELERLMGWLDWSEWVKCNPGCGLEEMCYMPTWPVGFPWFAKAPPPMPIPTDDFVPQEGMSSLASQTMSDPDGWIRPQPKCVRRVYPYRY